MSSDFIKKYIPLYILWLLFISFIAVSMAISTTAFSASLPTGVEFTAGFLQNSLKIFGAMATFQLDGVSGILLTLFFYIPSVPIIVWILEAIISFLDAVIPF